jgi:hypothetical protein
MHSDIDVLLCFDTTGSMYGVIDQVRREMKETAQKLMSAMPGVRIGIGCNGDYGDAPYTTQFLDFTTDLKKIHKFVNEIHLTQGFGNGGEAYEVLFNEARDLSWNKTAKKAMVLVADEIPHTPQWRENKKHLNWRDEVEALGKMGIKLYGVQALNHPESRLFYPELAKMTGGFHLRLNQFEQVTDILLAIGFQQAEDEQVLDAFEEECKKKGLYNRDIATVFDTLRNRKGARAAATQNFGDAGNLKLVDPGRFQVIKVKDDAGIADFVKKKGLPFKIGKGFYEFTKRETIQHHKEIVLMDKKSGDMFTGHAAREMLNLPDGQDIRLSPTQLDKYTVFVQSTSANRKLKAGTRFLYEVQADW